jgi:hypothetical protein
MDAIHTQSTSVCIGMKNTPRDRSEEFDEYEQEVSCVSFEQVQASQLR